MVQPMGWAVQLHWGALKKQAFGHNGDCSHVEIDDIFSVIFFLACATDMTFFFF